MAHDDHSLRRLYKGRISSLVADGTWREWNRRTVGKNMPYAGWFHTWAPGPNGTATGSSKSKGQNSRVTYFISGIDYAAPTTGPLLKKLPRSWPPDTKNADTKGGK